MGLKALPSVYIFKHILVVFRTSTIQWLCNYQCKAFRTGVMCSVLLVLETSLAAALWMSCSCLMVFLGRPRLDIKHGWASLDLSGPWKSSCLSSPRATRTRMQTTLTPSNEYSSRFGCQRQALVPRRDYPRSTHPFNASPSHPVLIRHRWSHWCSAPDHCHFVTGI